MSKLEIKKLKIKDIKVYKNNPRKNDTAVDLVVLSIEKFGFKVPILLDKSNEIISGHTRLRAAKKLGLTKVPVIYMKDLTDLQVKAFRIMDNKSQEFAVWDFGLLKNELSELQEKGFSLDATGFDMSIFSLGDEDEWIGMPDFEVKDQPYRLFINFKDKKEMEEFADKHKYFKKATKFKTTWSIWYPFKSTEDKRSLRYEE